MMSTIDADAISLEEREMTTTTGDHHPHVAMTGVVEIGVGIMTEGQNGTTMVTTIETDETRVLAEVLVHHQNDRNVNG